MSSLSNHEIKNHLEESLREEIKKEKEIIKADEFLPKETISHELFIKSLEVEFQQWCEEIFTIQPTRISGGYATYIKTLDLSLIDEPISLWATIRWIYNTMEITKHMIKQGYLINFIEYWDGKYITIDVIFDKFIKEEFNVEQNMHMSDITTLIDLHHFSNGPLIIDMYHKTFRGLVIKTTIENLSKKLPRIYICHQMKGKIAIAT